MIDNQEHNETDHVNAEVHDDTEESANVTEDTVNGEQNVKQADAKYAENSIIEEQVQ